MTWLLSKKRIVNVLSKIASSGLLISVISSTVYSQTIIDGAVLSTSGEKLPSATVVLLSSEDSIIVATAATDLNGNFSIISPDNSNRYSLKVSYVGYKAVYRRLRLTGKDTLILAPIKMQQISVELDEVTVSAEREKIVINGDTVEYNASSYEISLRGRVRELLRRLPGIEISADGTIMSEGEPVTRMTVNGKEMFGGNIQDIVRNIPADALDKVQVMDGRSMEARFNGYESSGREKAINLELKEEYKWMTFGDATAGAGLEERYWGNLLVNRINNDQQFSASLNSNNVNNLNVNEIFTMPDQQMAGDMIAHSGGLSFLKTLSRKLALTGSYSSLQNNSTVETSVSRDNFLPEGTSRYEDTRFEDNDSRSHIAALGVEWKDSANTIKATVNGSALFNEWLLKSSRAGYAPDRALSFQGDRDAKTENDLLDGTGTFFFGHKFNKKGRTVTVSSHYNVLDNETDETSLNLTNFFNDSILNDTRKTIISNASNNYTVEARYAEPIWKKSTLTAQYKFGRRSANSKSQTLLSDENRQTSIENVVETEFSYQQAGMAFHRTTKNSSYIIGGNVQYSDLVREQTETSILRRRYVNILPYGQVSLKPSKQTGIHIKYLTSIREPSINEMQPIQAQRDPLNKYLSNVSLTPENIHEGRVSVRKKSERGLMLAVNASGRRTFNAIVPSTRISNEQVRTVQYINAGDAVSSNVNVALTVPWDKLRSQLKLNPSYQHSTDNALLNGSPNRTRQEGYAYELRYAYSYKQNFQLSISRFESLTDVTTTGGLREKLHQEVHSAEASALMFNRLSLKGFWHFSRLDNTVSEKQTTISALNASMGFFLYKDGKAEIKLSGFNMLAANRGASQIVTSTFVEQRTYSAFKSSYYLITFTWFLDKYRGQ